MKDKITEILKTPLITSILLFIFGAILFINPADIIKTVTIILGGILILIGFIRLANYLGDKKKGIYHNSDLNYAIIIMTCGIIIIMCTDIIEFSLRLIMGGLILYNGINRLKLSMQLKDINAGTWQGHLIISILIIIIGLYIILKSNLIFSGIGLFMMFYAGLEIALYFMNNKKDKVIIIKNKH
ncbi:MAG: DUF308 domain-containing protein [Bacilli bacterium]|nr:DUF308 domain-containing protein [Bacilli bacterium]